MVKLRRTRDGKGWLLWVGEKKKDGSYRLRITRPAKSRLALAYRSKKKALQTYKAVREGKLSILKIDRECINRSFLYGVLWVEDTP